MALSQEESEELELLELEEEEAQYQASKVAAGPSKGDSALKGAQQGLTFGFADEMGGAIQGGMDKVAGLFGESPTEINARLLSEGTSGNIGPTDLNQMYLTARDENRDDYKKAQQANPGSYLFGSVAGGVLANAVPGAGLAKGAGIAKTLSSAALQGAAFGAGGSEQENIGGIVRDSLIGGGVGLLGGAAGYGVGKVLSGVARGTGKAIGRLAPGLENSAESMAVQATGATGKQASEFADDAGRELLDRGLVRFGDSAKNIADRTGKAMSEADAAISGALSKLDEMGVEASQDNIVAVLKKQIAGLQKDSSKAGVIRQMEKAIEDIVGTGESNMKVSAAEGVKRGWTEKAGNWLDPEAGQAGKTTYRAYQKEVERAALDKAPELAAQFIEGKKVHGLLAPIKEAAERRAMTLNQSPFGGLGDTAAAAAAMSQGGPAAATAVAGRRIVGPRLASSLSVTSDGLAKLAAEAPQMLGKFAGVIQEAATRGSRAVAATHFILQQTNPEYRKQIRVLTGDGDE